MSMNLIKSVDLPELAFYIENGKDYYKLPCIFRNLAAITDNELLIVLTL